MFFYITGTCKTKLNDFNVFFYIGVMVMIHGDDKGLVFPPHVGPLQIIVVPVPFKGGDTHAIYNAYVEIVQMFWAAGFHIEEDIRENYPPGWKYYHWEFKGVPLRIDISPRNIAKKKVLVKLKHN